MILDPTGWWGIILAAQAWHLVDSADKILETGNQMMSGNEVIKVKIEVREHCLQSVMTVLCGAGLRCRSTIAWEAAHKPLTTDIVMSSVLLPPSSNSQTSCAQRPWETPATLCGMRRSPITAWQMRTCSVRPSGGCSYIRHSPSCSSIQSSFTFPSGFTLRQLVWWWQQV